MICHGYLCYLKTYTYIINGTFKYDPTHGTPTPFLHARSATPPQDIAGVLLEKELTFLVHPPKVDDLDVKVSENPLKFLKISIQI